MPFRFWKFIFNSRLVEICTAVKHAHTTEFILTLIMHNTPFSCKTKHEGAGYNMQRRIYLLHGFLEKSRKKIGSSSNR